MSNTVNYSERDLLRAMKRAKKELGVKFSRDNYRKLHSDGYPNEYLIRKKFGNWGNAVRQLEVHNPHFVSDEEEQMLMYLNKAKHILGDNFKRDNYRMLKGFPSVHKLTKTFGSWTRAVNMADKLL